MKMTALVLLGIVLGLGLIILPTLGSPSYSSYFFFGSATQTGAADGKNDTGYNVLDGNSTVPAAESQGNSVYRSLSSGPMGYYGAPVLVLGVGLALAVVAYLLIRRVAL